MNPAGAEDRQGTRLLAACGAFLVLVLLLAASVNGVREAQEQRTEVDRPGTEHLVALLDVSDPPSRDQAAQLETRLQNVIKFSLRPGDVISVWTLGESAEGPLHQVIRFRRPASEGNPIFQNPRQIFERYELRVTRPIHALTAGLPNARPARLSPILEAIDALAELPELHGSGRRHLLLVSDLEQNSPKASFLTRQPSFEALARAGQLAPLLPKLEGVEVTVYVLPRRGQSLGLEMARRRFWRSLFDSCGAASVEVERL